MTIPKAFDPTRRDTLKTLGYVAGASLLGQFALGCSSDDGPSGPGDEEARDDLLLFVPGFMSELYTAFSVYAEQAINQQLRNSAGNVPVIGDRIATALPWIDLPIEPGGFVSFDGVRDHFDGLGIEWADMSSLPGDFNTQKGVVDNGAAIAAWLDGLSGKRVTIVSHSKGGLDTLQALLENADLLGGTVGAWVALQAPFAGSPVADNVPSAIAAPLLNALGGDGQALDDLKTAPRTQYMAANANRILELTAKIPVISCHTTFSTAPGESIAAAAAAFAQLVINSSILADIAVIVASNLLDPAAAAAEATALIANRARNLATTAMSTVPMMGLSNLTMAEPNDGLVTVASSQLPGSVIRKLNPAADHAAPVMEVSPFKNFWTESHRNAAATNLVEEVRGGA